MRHSQMQREHRTHTETTTDTRAWELAFGVVPLEAVESPILQEGIAYWSKLRDGRKFPARKDVTARGLKTILRNTVLLRVIDGGRDYEYRVVGDAFLLAHHFFPQGHLWSEVRAVAPDYAAAVKPAYDMVVETPEPHARSGWTEKSERNPEPIFAEAVYLPIGPDERTVDHILALAAYVRGIHVDK